MNIVTHYVRHKAGFLPLRFKQHQMVTGPQYVRYYSTKKSLYASMNGRPAFYCLSGVAILGIGGLCFNRSYHAEAHGAGKEVKAFNSYGFIPLKLRETQDINHNVKRLRFDLPNEDQVAGLTVSSFVLIRIAKPGTEDKLWPSYVFRPYTPVSKEVDVGFLDLIVKRYDSGGASELIHNLNPGETLQFFGKPIPARKYQPNKVDSISMIAAGSGITPMVRTF